MGISHVAPVRGRNAGLSHPCPAGARAGTDGGAVVRGKAGFTHVMNHFRHDVSRKRFSTHGKLHGMEITIRKDHVAEKPRAGTEGGAGIGSRKGRGPTQWGGPAESSVPGRGASKCHAGTRPRGIL